MSSVARHIPRWRFRLKLRMAIFATCLLSVLFVMAGMSLFEHVTYVEQLGRILNIKADVVSENSKVALASGDSSNGARVLGSLASQPHVTKAALYGNDGKLFATYARSGVQQAFRASPEPEGWRFDGEALVLYKKITSGNSQLGTVFVSMDLIEAKERFWAYGKIALLVLAGSLVIAYFIALVLERNLSRPIISLARTADQVTKDHDYSLRAPVLSEDESGALAGAFNQMLENIEKREAEVRTSEKRYRTTLDHMMEGCQIIGFDWQYLYINEVAASQGRRERSQFVGHTMMEIYPGIENTNLFTQLRRCMDERIPYSIENEFVYPDNSSGWFTLNIQPVPEGVFILSEDITRAKDLALEVEKHREHLEILVEERTRQLELVNKELEAFSYSVSHDLRAPLRHVNGFVDLLKKSAGSSLTPLCTRYVDMIAGSAVEMGHLVDDLLSFSRMGRAEMQKTTVNLHQMVHHVVSKLEPECQSRKISWEISELPAVEGDLSMLRQVWTNLLSNAIKYTRPRLDPRVHIGVERKDTELVFFVRDNGVGFNADYSHKLFGVFQRLHSAKQFEGTGIGLANVRRIIERHGGEVWAEGAEGKGATFFFTLPTPKGDDT